MKATIASATAYQYKIKCSRRSVGVVEAVVEDISEFITLKHRNKCGVYRPNREDKENKNRHKSLNQEEPEPNKDNAQ